MFSASNNSPKKLSSAAMFDFAVAKILVAANKFSTEIQKSIAFADANERIYGMRFSVNKGSVVLTNPVTDNADNSADLVPLPSLLKKIISLQAQNNNTDTYIIPLVERQPIPVVGTPREHATLLVIKNKECYFFDSCSDSFINFTGFMSLPTVSGSSVYSLEPLKAMLKNTGEFTLNEAHYLGCQIDNINCGRYTADNAGKVASEVFGNKNIATLAYSLKNNMPNVDSLVAESITITINKLIAHNNVIRSIRGMQTLTEEEKIERIPTIKELLQNQTQTMIYPTREKGIDNSDSNLYPETGYYDPIHDNEIQNRIEINLQPDYTNSSYNNNVPYDPELDLTGSKTFAENEFKENSQQNNPTDDEDSDGEDYALFDQETVMQTQLRNARLLEEAQEAKALVNAKDESIKILQASVENNKKQINELTLKYEKSLNESKAQIVQLQKQLSESENTSKQINTTLNKIITEYKRIEKLLAERNVEYKSVNNALITRNEEYNHLEAKANEAFIQASSVATLSKQVSELQSQNTALNTQITSLGQERDAIREELNQVVNAVPQKTPGWKYMLAGAFVLLGLAAIGSGVGALLVLGLSVVTSGIIIASGGLTALSSLFYSHGAYKRDQLEQRLFDNALPAPAPRVIAPAVMNNSNPSISTGGMHFGPLFKVAAVKEMPTKSVSLTASSGLRK